MAIRAELREPANPRPRSSVQLMAVAVFLSLMALIAAPLAYCWLARDYVTLSNYEIEGPHFDQTHFIGAGRVYHRRFVLGPFIIYEMR